MMKLRINFTLELSKEHFPLLPRLAAHRRMAEMDMILWAMPDANKMKRAIPLAVILYLGCKYVRNLTFCVSLAAPLLHYCQCHGRRQCGDLSTVVHLHLVQWSTCWRMSICELQRMYWTPATSLVSFLCPLFLTTSACDELRRYSVFEAFFLSCFLSLNTCAEFSQQFHYPLHISVQRVCLYSGKSTVSSRQKTWGSCLSEGY